MLVYFIRKTIWFICVFILLITWVEGQKTVGDWCVLHQDELGICTLLNECPDAIKLAHVGHRPVICSFKGTTPIVCCGESLKVELYNATSTTPKAYDVEHSKPKSVKPAIHKATEAPEATNKNAEFPKPVPEAWSHLERVPIFGLEADPDPIKRTVSNVVSTTPEDEEGDDNAKRIYNLGVEQHPFGVPFYHQKYPRPFEIKPHKPQTSKHVLPYITNNKRTTTEVYYKPEAPAIWDDRPTIVYKPNYEVSQRNRTTTERNHYDFESPHEPPYNAHQTTRKPHYGETSTTTRRPYYQITSSSRPQYEGYQTTRTPRPQYEGYQTTRTPRPQYESYQTTRTPRPQYESYQTTRTPRPQYEGYQTISNSRPQYGELQTTSTSRPYYNQYQTTTIRSSQTSTTRRKKNTYKTTTIQPQYGGHYTPTTTKRNNWVTPGSSTNQKRISELKCDEYSQQVTETIGAIPLVPDPNRVEIHLDKCEINAQQLIVGGEKTTLGEFPHMAVLGYQDQEDQDISWSCGASLISDYFVITAAHCVATSVGPPVVVRLGELNLKESNDGANPMDYTIDDIIKHPEYRRPAKYNDIALIRLSRRVMFNKYIRPACLYNRDYLAVDKALASGWGRIDVGENQSDTLLKVALSIIDRGTCNRLYRSDMTSLPRGITESMLCAGELAGGKDTCQGDSGGPLQITYKSNHCIYQLIGVTSFGKLCAAKNAPGVYTRISHYLPWIEKVVWPQNTRPNHGFQQ